MAFTPKEYLGRDITLSVSGATIASVQSKSIEIGNTAIDITSDDASGFRTLLDERGERHLNLKVAGLAKDQTIKNHMLGADALVSYKISWPLGSGATSGAIASGQCRIVSYSESGDYKSAVKFDAQLQSAGQIYFSVEA